MAREFGVQTRNTARLLTIVLLAGVWLCLAEDPPGPKILRPMNRSSLAPGPLVLIARTAGKAEFRLDGKAVPGAQPAPNVLFAAVTVASGPHEVVLVTAAGEEKIGFFAGPKPPEGFAPFRIHPPGAGCETCHAVKQGAWAFKQAGASASCFGCHDPKPFTEIHSHNAEVLQECQLCHSPHGGTARLFLKMSKELACKQCHG